MMRSKVIILLIILIPSISSAELIVVKSKSGAVSALPYLAPIHPVSSAILLQQIKENKKLLAEDKNNLAAGVQMNGSHMTAGKISPFYNAPLAQVPPFFIVGNDKSSRAWLKNNEGVLQKIHAVGFLVNATETNAVLLEKNSGLPIAAVSSNGLSALTGTDRYPVLINQGEAQQ